MLRILALAMMAAPALAADISITGTVQSKCVIQTDKEGIYGNPTADKLSTATADGGVVPIVRYDVALADSYTARITYPTNFSTSPALTDVVNWSGSVELGQVSDAAMADYETNKVTYDATTEFDLHTAGSTWFKINSTAEYGYGKALPGGIYRTVATAECIAK